MKYYLHDVNSFSDEKITQVYMRFGYEGLGLFYTLLEKIAIQEKPVNTEVLKHQLHVGKKLEKCWNFLEEIGLICSKNGETFNEQLLKYSEKYQIKKEKNRKRIQEWRDNEEVTKNVTRYESVSNAPKVKESKVKEIEVEERVIKNPYEETTSTATKRIFAIQSDTYEQQAKEDQSLIELICMQNKLKPERTKELIAEFFQLKRVIDHSWDNYSDLKSNILNWLPKKLNAKTPINEAPKKPIGRVV